MSSLGVTGIAIQIFSKIKPLKNIRILKLIIALDSPGISF